MCSNKLLAQHGAALQRTWNQVAGAAGSWLTIIHPSVAIDRKFSGVISDCGIVRRSCGVVANLG
jgi:hypothetical protein